MPGEVWRGSSNQETTDWRHKKRNDFDCRHHRGRELLLAGMKAIRIPRPIPVGRSNTDSRQEKRQDEQIESLCERHGRSLPRMNLALKCNAIAAKSQTAVEREARGVKPMVAPGVMNAATTQPVDARSRVLAVSFTRSL
jgi:hypothetical protein